MCTLVNLRAGLLHSQQSVIKMKSQLHRLPQRAAIHYPLMQADTFTCIKLSLCNYAGWTFTPQTLSSHCLLKHRPFIQPPNDLQSFQSSPGHAPPHPQGWHLHLRSWACFQLERGRETLLNCCIKKVAARIKQDWRSLKSKLANEPYAGELETWNCSSYSFTIHEQ